MAASVAALVLAAGRGLRSGEGIPKQFRRIGPDPVILMSLRSFADHPEIGHVQPVINPDDIGLYEDAAGALKLPKAVFGGATRQASVFAGLQALEAVAPEIVLVHDAARPFASAALLSRAVAAGRASGAAVPALTVTDTVKVVDAKGAVVSTPDRSTLRSVQTPQAFHFSNLLAAHRRAADAGRDDFTDDAALAEWAGMAVTTFEGEPGNVKLTHPEDFARAQMHNGVGYETRTGMGFDVHAIGPGNHVTLCGVLIPHTHGLSGHSDADVALHALVDAILGALSDGDIGAHFPPSDPQWRGASSDKFLAFALERLRARSGRLIHADITLVCEAPKIGPHRDAMRTRIAEIAGISPDRVGVKATTNEGLGFIGRGEGIVAYATASVSLPTER